MRGKDKYWLVGLGCAVVFFAAISIAINALAPDLPTTSNQSAADSRVQDSTFVIRLGPVTGQGLSQQEVIGIGRSVCTQLADGSSGARITSALVTTGLTREAATRLVTAAVESYCPSARATLDADRP